MQIDRRILCFGLSFLCFLGMSFESTSVIRGVWLPLGVAVFMILGSYFWLKSRVSSVARDETYVPSEAERAVLKRAAEKARPDSRN